MDFQSLQNGFGTDPAKLYVFDGAIPEDNNPIEYITHKFVEDAGTNLIACVVTEVQNTWLVYTKDLYELSDTFRLVAEFPLPVPEIPSEETPPEETPVEQGPQ